MGVESYFINAKLNQQFNIEQLKSFLVNNSFDVSPYIIKFDGIFPKKKISELDFVVEGIVLCTLFEKNDISLQACFSCYEKSMDIMSSVLLKFRDNNILQYAYYGDHHFKLQVMNRNNIIDVINDISSERFNYFQTNYTRKEVELLPNEFYKYYNKHRKVLKE